jgi:hypothetical protein
MAYPTGGFLQENHHACAGCVRRDKCRAIYRNPFRDAVLLPARNMTRGRLGWRPLSFEHVAQRGPVCPRIWQVHFPTSSARAPRRGALANPAARQPAGAGCARGSKWQVPWRARAGPRFTKTERPRSANLLQMPRGLMCKPRRGGREKGGLAPSSRGIDRSLQPLPVAAIAGAVLYGVWQVQ